MATAVVVEKSIPAGTMKQWCGGTPPSGFLLCDGSLISRTAYPILFAAIGTRWGSGDGLTTFALPDMRGRVTRGRDAGSGNDPDAASRTASNTGGQTGNNVGSVQTDDITSHVHGVTIWHDDGTNGAFVRAAGNTAGTTGTQNSNGFGGNETRMKNAYVDFIIKY